ncbi:MAG: hypothetical protein MUE90_04490 [Thermoanaerobaculales bacterium]|nr:hypothetical protein [Thermoanaerobaculales bacterium]
MLELARGSLEGTAAAEAEELRQRCADCGRLWAEAFDPRMLADIDAAVAGAFADFSPPARRRGGWWSLAAAAGLIAAIGMGSALWRGSESSQHHLGPARPKVLTAWDFEEGPEIAPSMEDPAASGAAPDETAPVDAVFRSGLESGDLSTWSSHS